MRTAFAASLLIVAVVAQQSVSSGPEHVGDRTFVEVGGVAARSEWPVGLACMDGAARVVFTCVVCAGLSALPGNVVWLMGMRVVVWRQHWDATLRWSKPSLTG